MFVLLFLPMKQSVSDAEEKFMDMQHCLGKKTYELVCKF